MKRSLRALAWAAACWLMSAQAQAESPNTAIRPVSYNLAAGACTDATCDAAAPGCAGEASCAADPSCKYFDPSCAVGEATCGSGGCCSNSCNFFDRISPCCEHGDPWSLIKFSKCRQDRGWKAGGWVNGSFAWNPSNPANKFNGPVTWNDRSNEGHLNEAWLFVEKATNTGGCGWDIGGRVDTFYGSNARFVTETGREVRGNNTFAPNWFTSKLYGVSLPNAYVETAYNNLKVKWGSFVSPVGYMTVGTPLNIFTTLPYTYQYGEPFTHTGALATWTASDKWTLGGGVIRGWDNFNGQFNPHLGYLGTTTRTFDNGNTLAWVGVLSPEASFSPTSSGFNGANGFSTRYFQTLVYTRLLTEKLTHVIQSDFGMQYNATATGDHARWYGLNQYLIYKANDCWSWAIGGEWFRDEEGFRTVTVGAPTNTGSFRTAPLGGYAGNFWQTTMGPAWRPNPNLMIRSNLRFDYYGGPASAGTAPGGAPAPLPFDDNSSRSQSLWINDITFFF
jgi:hypothetical protein